MKIYRNLIKNKQFKILINSVLLLIEENILLPEIDNIMTIIFIEVKTIISICKYSIKPYSKRTIIFSNGKRCPKVITIINCIKMF